MRAALADETQQLGLVAAARAAAAAVAQKTAAVFLSDVATPETTIGAHVKCQPKLKSQPNYKKNHVSCNSAYEKGDEFSRNLNVFQHFCSAFGLPVIVR